jgi:endo-1,4-beta-xylanase
MKFGLIHPQPTVYRFADADSLAAFARSHGMQFYGHTLLWHSQQPDWLTAGAPTRASLLAALKGHIETVAGRYAGQVVAWDVANEMIADDGTGLRKSFWTEVVGPDVIDSAFVWARRADRTAKLYLNDYSVELVNRKSDSLLALATRLKARGIPIHGIGLQGHFTLPAPNAQQLRTNIARFQAAGFEVRYTELDVRITPAQSLDAQAAAFGAVLDACLQPPRCAGLTIWGLSDRYSWIPGFFPGFGRALPFDEQLQPKPAYRTLRDLLERTVRGP